MILLNRNWKRRSTKRENNLKIKKQKYVIILKNREKQRYIKKYQDWVLIKIEAKIEITDWFETKNGRHVHLVLQNVALDFRKNAGEDIVAAMG